MRQLWSVLAAVTLVATAAQARDPARQWQLPASERLHGSKAVIERQPCCEVSRNAAMPDSSGAGTNSFLRPIPVWADETHVTFEGESPPSEDKPNAKQLPRVEGGKGQWQC